MRGQQELELNFVKPSADAPLGINLKRGFNTDAIKAIAESLKVNTTLKAIRCAQNPKRKRTPKNCQ